MVVAPDVVVVVLSGAVTPPLGTSPPVTSPFGTVLVADKALARAVLCAACCACKAWRDFCSEAWARAAKADACTVCEVAVVASVSVCEEGTGDAEPDSEPPLEGDAKFESLLPPA